MLQPLSGDVVLARSNWRERGILGILFMMNFCHMVDFVIIMPLGPQLMRTFQISTQQFSLLVSAYAISAGIMGLFAAFFTDRFDRKKTMLFVYTGFTVGTLLCALAPSFQLLLLARVIAGAFGGVISATALAMIGDVIPFERRGAAIGVVMSAFAIASVVGIPLGLKTVMLWSWHGPFMMLVILSCVILLAAQKILPPVRAHLQTEIKKSSWQEFITVLRNPVYQRAYCMTSTLSISGFLIIPYISAYAVFNVKVPESDLLWIYFFGGLFTFFSTNLIGKLTDRYGSFRMLAIVNLLSIIPTLLLTHIGEIHMGVFLMITTLFMMGTSGRFTPAMNLMHSIVSSPQRGAFMGMSFAFQQISAASAAYVAGIIIQQTADQTLIHYNWAGFISMGFVLISFGLAYSLRQYSKRR